MKKTFIFIVLLVTNILCLAQSKRVAILDFENISGIAKYDGLGKAMSSMLISDIVANVSPKRLQLVERAQIQKVLKEQNFQASGSVNKSTAVQAGKILGVSYLLVGDVYVLNDQLIINARLTNTETGDIVFSKKQEGKTVAWLTLKTNIAKDLATSLSQPFIEPTIPDKEISVATITTFGNAVAAKDSGNVQMAESLSSTVIDFNPEFRYVDDLRKEIEEIKKRLEKVEQDVEITTTDPIAAAQNYDKLGNFKEAEKYYQIGLKRLKKNQIGQYLLYNILLSELSFKYQDYEKTLYYSDNILEVYSLLDNAIILKAQSLIKLNKEKEFIEWSKNYLARANEITSYKIFDKESSKYLLKNKLKKGSNDLSINISYVKGFSIEVNGYQIYQGDQNIFRAIVGEFSETNNRINGLNSTLFYLKNLNSKPQNNKYDYEVTDPFYLPKSQYETKISGAKDELVIAKSGEPYIGAYFSRSNGTSWTKENPGECTCYRLLPKSDYVKLNQSFIRFNWQTSTFQAEGWYSLLNKEFVNARRRFGQIILYQIHEDAKDYKLLYDFIDQAIMNLDSIKIDGYQGLRDILDRESINYSGEDKLKFIEQLCKSRILLSSDVLGNEILNYAHSYLIEDKIDTALEVFRYIDPNYIFKDYELTVSEIIEKDLTEFLSKGIVKKNDVDYIMKNIK
jgi:TolB-like protein